MFTSKLANLDCSRKTSMASVELQIGLHYCIPLVETVEMHFECSI
jgi:hypothetical protein